MIEPQDMLDWLQIRIHSAEGWLENFSEGKRKRPDHEIEMKRKDIEHFTEIKTAYLKALSRRQATES